MRSIWSTSMQIVLVALMWFLFPCYVQGGEVHVVAGKGDMVRLEKLVAADPSTVRARDEKGRTPLHFAGISGYRDIAAFLLAKGADIDAKDNEGCTPLYIVFLAASGGVPNVIGLKTTAEFLIQKGADVNARDLKNGATPLHGAVLCGYKDMVNLLIAKGAEVNAKDKTQGSTPLHAAALVGNKEIAELLISKGADIDAKDTTQNATPLHFAVAARHRAVVEVLIAKGADINSRMINGRSPLDIAVATGQQQIADILRSRSSGRQQP